MVSVYKLFWKLDLDATLEARSRQLRALNRRAASVAVAPAPDRRGGELSGGEWPWRLRPLRALASRGPRSCSRQANHSADEPVPLPFRTFGSAPERCSGTF